MGSTPRIVVAGGNGFLGSRICKAAVHHGWAVTSISRSGQPYWPTQFNVQEPPEWASNVEWHKANILHPEQYSEKLENATAVIHSMGILLEADYKGVLSGKEPIISGLKKAFDSTKGHSHGLRSSNPLERIPSANQAQSPNGEQPLTYEIMNRDSALVLAHESIKHHIPTFAYISAADGFPLLPARYIQTKRQAEESLLQMAGLRALVFRPAFMYDTTRKISVPLAFATGVTSALNSLFGKRLPLLGAAGHKPLAVETVADAVVEGIAEDGASGILSVDKIEELAKKVWRRQML